MRRAVLVCIAGCLASGRAHSESLAAVAERTRNAVVHLAVYDGSGRQASTGSGFFVSADGRVVTNHHVIEDAFRVTATLEGGRELEAEGLLAADPVRDLAVLKLPGSGHPHLRLGRLSQVKPGQPVAVIGSPVGLTGSLSTGIVSAVREQGLDAGPPRETHSSRAWQLQITAPISPGSSGSPILAQDGVVIGVAVGIVDFGQALNFGVSADYASELLASIEPDAKPESFANLQRGQVRDNLLISALGIGTAALVGWAIWRFGARKSKQKSVV